MLGAGSCWSRRTVHGQHDSNRSGGVHTEVWRHAGSSSATQLFACFQVESLQQQAAAAVEDSSGQQEALAAAQEEVEELRQQLEAAQAAADGWQRQAEAAHSAAAEVQGGSHRRAGG